MLLWLSLLLWSSACWARQIFGPGGGTQCSVPQSRDSDITGIRVSMGAARLIKGISLRQGSVWSKMCGKEDVIIQEFILKPGEHIISVYGISKRLIRYLVFSTDLGRRASFGQKEGSSFTVNPDEPGRVLTGIFGQYSPMGLTGVGIKWGPARVQTPPVTKQKTTEHKWCSMF